MRRYESYKDSGVEWLGEVPSHWGLTIGMNVFRENKRDNKGMKEKTVLSLSYGQIIIKPEEKLVGLVPESFETYQIVEPNDIIIRCTDLQNDQTSLRTGLAKDKGIITSAYLNLKVINNYSAKFLHYYLHTLDITKVLYKFGSGLRQNLSFLDFKRLPIIDIPLSEQQKIAQFLDDKTAKIDQAVDLAEKQIALLKEHKQILIQNAVTRGLNPDVPLKDSGVEWIGQVPEHWEVMRLKFMLSEKLKYGANESAELDDPEQPRYIRITDIDEQGNLKNDTFKSLEFEKAKDYLLKLNDILLARSGATAGKSYIYKENLKNFACYAGYLIRVRLEQKKFNAKFVNYYFQSVGYWDWIKSVNIQATIQNVSAEKYNDFLLSVPNLQEQVTIVDYLDQKTAKIDQAIALKTAHIEKLKEYKSVLINDVVTGKVQV